MEKPDRTYSPSGWGGVPTSQVAPSCSKSGSSEEPVLTTVQLMAQPKHPDAPVAAGGVDPEIASVDVHEPASSEDDLIPQAAIEAGGEGCWSLGKHDYTWDAADSEEKAICREVAVAVLEAALPHLRAFQLDTQVRVGYELGRREAGEQIERALTEAGARGRFGLQVVQSVTKGDSNG